MRQTIRTLSASAFAIAAATGQVQAAFAQSASEATEQQEGIQDIVVTAERTERSLQKTPISIQVYSGEEISQRGIATVQQLANVDASINVGYSTNQPFIAVRGIASTNATEIGDPAVSVAFDGAFTNRPYGLLGGMYDVERVEILRGPQGTLFGRNSTGGTLNVISARPSMENEGRVNVEVGSYNALAADGYVNAVLAEGLQARASFMTRGRDGFRDNAPAKRRGDDENIKSVRLQLAFQPTPELEGWILFGQTKEGGVGLVVEVIPFNYQVSFANGEPVHEVPSARSNGRAYPAYAQNERDLRSTDIRGALTYTLPGGETINYLGSYNKVRYRRGATGNAGRFQIPPRQTPPVFVPITTPSTLDGLEKPETINQELRIAANPSNRLFWQIGGFFFREKNTIDTVVSINPGSAEQRNALRFTFPEVLSKSYAIYGSVRYAISDQLNLTVGGRNTWDEKSRTGTTTLFPLQTGAPANVVASGLGSTKANKFTWLAGLDYQVTPENLLYAKVSTGYKVGGFNSGVVVIPYGSENLTAYEIGSKNRFLDNRLQLNLAGYYLNYRNQQVSTFVSDPLATGSRTVNAGSSRVYGLEADVIYEDDGFGRLSISANLQNARYSQFVAAAGWNATINQDLSGNRLPLAPDFTAAIGYEHPFDVGSGRIVPRVNVKVETTKFFQPENYNSSRQPTYAMADAALEYQHGNGDWTIQAFVRNLTDETVLVDGVEFYTGRNYAYAYQPPRTYGLRFSAGF